MTTQAGLRRDGGERPTSRLQRSALWRLKVRLQFTGWLQYIPNAAAALVFLAVAAVGGLIGAVPLLLFWLPAGIGMVLLAILVFDLLTVRLGVCPIDLHPERADGLDAFDLMRSRRSCRSFQRRNLTDADRAELMDAVRRHTRPDRLVGSRPIRLEYVAAPITVWPTVGAHEFLVAIAPHDYDRTAIIDVGRSLEKVVIDATRMGVATCWIGPGADQRSIARHLGSRFDPERDHVVCVCAVGYRSRFEPLTTRGMELMQHRRYPLERLFFADPRFQASLPVDEPPFSSFGRCYEVCQWSPSSYNGQTTRCAAVMEQVGDRERLERFDFCAATDSRYYAPVALGIWVANWETGCEALGTPGHVAVLTPGQRGVTGAPALPRYDVSWVADRRLAT